MPNFENVSVKDESVGNAGTNGCGGYELVIDSNGVPVRKGAAGVPGPSGVQNIVQGAHVTVDNTDPANPIVSASVGVLSVVAGTNVTVDNTDPAHPVVSATGGGSSRTGQIPNIPVNTGTGSNHVNASGLWVPSVLGNVVNSDFSGVIKGIDPTLFQAGDIIQMSNNGNTSFNHQDSGTAAGSKLFLKDNTNFVNDSSFNTIHTFAYMKPFDSNTLAWFEIGRFQQSAST